jgi:hypothetical protein
VKTIRDEMLLENKISIFFLIFEINYCFFQMTKKVLVLIANGSEEIEAVTTIDGLLFIFNYFYFNYLGF